MKRKGDREKKVCRPSPDTMDISFCNFVSQDPILSRIFGEGEKDSSLRSLRKKRTSMCSPGGGEDDK